MTFITDDYSGEAFAKGRRLYRELMQSNGPVEFFTLVAEAMERDFDEVRTAVILPQQIACVFKCDELAQQQKVLTFEEIMQKIFGEPVHHMVSRPVSVIARMTDMPEADAVAILTRSGYIVEDGHVAHHRSLPKPSPQHQPKFQPPSFTR